MTENMHVHDSQNMQPSLRLRVEKFDLMTRILGCESEAARAELVGVSYRTMLRARTKNIGEVFAAQTIVSLRRHQDTLGRYGLKPTLDELFEVVETPVEATASA